MREFFRQKDLARVRVTVFFRWLQTVTLTAKRVAIRDEVVNELNGLSFSGERAFHCIPSTEEIVSTDELKLLEKIKQTS